MSKIVYFDYCLAQNRKYQYVARYTAVFTTLPGMLTTATETIIITILHELQQL